MPSSCAEQPPSAIANPSRAPELLNDAASTIRIALPPGLHAPIAQDAGATRDPTLVDPLELALHPGVRTRSRGQQEEDPCSHSRGSARSKQDRAQGVLGLHVARPPIQLRACTSAVDLALGARRLRKEQRTATDERHRGP